ncbi:hypothetical protein NH340_JMT00757 [Sarcoptes scabiei]|nr:hypothetical protein NH340_JMT00757 [Sarcoptes scabiei]
MDDNELRKTFGELFCHYFGNHFIRKHLRIDLDSKLFEKQIVKHVLSEDFLSDKLISPKFWMNVTDKIDSKFTYKRLSIKNKITWKRIARKFFISIMPNHSYYRINHFYVEKYDESLRMIFLKHQFNCTNDLIKFLYEEDSMEVSSLDISFDTSINDRKIQTPVKNRDSSKQTDQFNIENDTYSKTRVGTISKKLNTSIDEKQDPEIESPCLHKLETMIEVVEEKSNNTENVSLEPKKISCSSRSSTPSLNEIIEITNNLIDNLTKQSEIEKDCTSDESLIYDEKSEINLKKNSESLLAPKRKKTKKSQTLKNKIKLRKIADGEELDEFLQTSEFNQNFSPKQDNDLNLKAEFNNQNYFRANNLKLPYTEEEDFLILRYIITTNRYSEIKGKKLWIDMENDRICPNRTWQSMKERYRRIIAPNLPCRAEAFQISSHIVEYLLTNTGPIDRQSLKNRIRSSVSQSSLDISLSETSTKNTSRILSGYSLAEDLEIIKFLYDTTETGFKGKKIWSKLAKHSIAAGGRERSWQSLKERFLKRILPKIYTYDNITYDRTMEILNECKSKLDNYDKVVENLESKFQK